MIRSNECKNRISLHPGGTELTLETAENAGLQAGDRVLDIGCGTGSSLMALQEKYGIVPFGIDISEEILEIACDGWEGTAFVCCDASQLPFPDLYFDAVMMECVITLLDDPASSLLEAGRVLKPGGRLILSTLVRTSGDSGSSPAADGFHICRDGLADPSGLTSFLADSGFSLIVCEDRKKELTQYMIDSIMYYGSLEKRIEAETAATGASVFDCSRSYDPGSLSYYSYVFIKNYA